MGIADDVGKLWLEDQRRMMIAASMPYADQATGRSVWREVNSVWDSESGGKMKVADGKRAEQLERLQHQLDEAKRQREQGR